MSARQDHRPNNASKSSPAALNTAEWFRQVERLVRLARAQGPASPQVAALGAHLVEGFADLIEFHSPLVMRCSALEIWLRDELVFRHDDGHGGEPAERGLPFLLYRDGVRGLTLDAGTSRADARTLIDAIVRVAAAPASDEDLASLLWCADLDGLSIELAPFEEVVPGATPAAPARLPSRDEPGAAGLALVETPPAPVSWPDSGAPADVLAAWTELRRGEPEAREAWRAAARADAGRQWTERVETLVRDVLAHDTGPVAREALATAVVSWLAGAAQRCDWSEAARALECLRRSDPERRWSCPLLLNALGALDADLVAERLDTADRDTQGRFFAFAVRVGRPSLDLLVRVLARAGLARVRAAATTALGYVCADDATALSPYVRDSRWHVARNIVFVLGQLGGEETGEPLALALRHPDLRVRRTAVTALGQVPVHRRTPLLVRQLDTPDPETPTAVLALMAREPDARASASLLERIGSADFESRPEEVRLALLLTLAEIADDSALPVLSSVLNAGGWFARGTPERTGAARALVRIGTARSLEVVHTGLRSRADAVRAACQEALAGREKIA